ncbi:MAG: 50S ribosomal protein L4 [Bacilli bacterium]|nr:50S ribosomal protein L4 [Bacilli bacterium]
MPFDVFSISGQKIESIDVKESFLNVKDINEHAVYRAVNVYNANKRQATAKTKNRSEVRGGGKKPWRQKGTGRARAGSIRSPIWRGGGIIFGPRGNQNFKLKQNKKEYLLALKSAIIGKINSEYVRIIKESEMQSGNNKKTKEVVKILKNFNIKKKDSVLFVMGKYNEKLFLISKNISNLKMIDVSNINVFDILKFKYLFITEKSMKSLENRIK